MTETHQLPRQIPALQELHGLLRQYYERFSIDEKTAFCLDLAAEEIFTNMVRHNESDSSTISMEVDFSESRIRLRWVDHGVTPFDPKALPAVDVTRPMEERTPGGLGLHLVKSVVDQVSYVYEDGDMHVEVVKEVGA